MIRIDESHLEKTQPISWAIISEDFLLGQTIPVKKRYKKSEASHNFGKY